MKRFYQKLWKSEDKLPLVSVVEQVSGSQADDLVLLQLIREATTNEALLSGIVEISR